MAIHPGAARIILEIIGQGLLRIRAAGWAGDSDRCAIEADHLHNLPDLLRNYSPALLKSYWEAQRHSYMSQSTEADYAVFTPLWNELRLFVESNQTEVIGR